MRLHNFLLFCFFTFIFSAAVTAQQSNKSKSKTKLYEKGLENKGVRVRNMNSVNSLNTDYSPCFYKNGLVFVSSRAKFGPKDKATGEVFSDLYFSPFDATGEPASPEKFSLKINTEFYEGPVSFGRGFKTMFFTRNNMEKGVPKADRNRKVHLKIYEADRGKSDWVNVRELPFNSINYSCRHPSISPDGQKLYFASDMPGGFGGFDLYVCERSGNGWSEPKNLGADVNTPENEGFPFIHVGGSLFFSSKGHNTIGGADLFFASKNADGNYEITNIGEPYNSPADELGIILNDDMTAGYFTSNRSGGFGKDDIWGFTNEKTFPDAEKPVSKLLTLQVLDAADGQPLPGASVWVFEPSPDGFISRMSKDSSLKNMEYYDIDFEAVEPSSNVFALNLVRKEAGSFGAADNFTGATGEAKQVFLPYRTYLVVVSAAGYGDSEKMVMFEPGEEPGKVVVKLSKEAPCLFAAGTVATTDLGYRLTEAKCTFINRTTRKKATARTNGNGEFQICLPGMGEYLVRLEKDGHKPKEEIVVAAKERELFFDFRMIPTKINGNDPVIPPGKLQEGAIIVMDRIVYEMGSAILTESGTRHMDALANLMRNYPEMEIDLVSHTDSRGDAATNAKLSQNRAEFAKGYLVWRKVSATRINAVGKGESTLRNGCNDAANCPEKEHLYNMRTEILVRKLGKPAN